MAAALAVRFEPNSHRMRFEAFPAASLEYSEKGSFFSSSWVQLSVTDVESQKIRSIYLNVANLNAAGISFVVMANESNNPERITSFLTNASVIDRLLQKAIPVVSKYLAPEHLTFFEDKAFANRAVSFSVYQGKKHLTNIPATPGMYFDTVGSSVNIFINLKKTPALGKGTFGKVRKVLWLTAPGNQPQIVAKKVIKSTRYNLRSIFQSEVRAMQEFSGKRGVISLIGSVESEVKSAIFVPQYQCDLFKCFQRSSFPLSLDEILSVSSQWLEGLAHISEKGIHGDLKPTNLLLRRNQGRIEGVIADLGAYRPHSEAEHGLTTMDVAPPEYFARKQVTAKQDVWGMGLSLYEMFSQKLLPNWGLGNEREMEAWTFKLTPGWILKQPLRMKMPPFLLVLIDQMLDPDPEQRVTAKEAFARFSSGYALWIEKEGAPAQK